MMTRTVLVGVVGVLGACAAGAFAQGAAAGAPENATCPVSGEALEAGCPTISYEGHTIGFCCDRCDDRFLGWSDEKKAQFIATSLKQPASTAPAAAPAAGAGFAGDPYLLGTCPVSGKKLGAMGDPLVKTIDGREVRFCCGGCVEPFESKKAEYFGKIDEQIIADQMAFYPTTTCVVSGEPLTDDGEDIAINRVYKNRLVRFCCKNCIKKFEADPAAYIAKLDKAVADAQRPGYPLGECVVAGDELDEMGDPYEIVVANRLVRFCCDGCVPEFKESPAKFIAIIDAAWKAKGMPGKAQAPKSATDSYTAGG